MGYCGDELLALCKLITRRNKRDVCRDDSGEGREDHHPDEDHEVDLIEFSRGVADDGRVDHATLDNDLQHLIDGGEYIQLRVVEDESEDHDHDGHEERMEDDDIPPRACEYVLLVVML